MSNIPNLFSAGSSSGNPAQTAIHQGSARRRFAAFGLLAVLAFLTVNAQAQFTNPSFYNTNLIYARVKPGQVRVTVPVNAASSTLITNKVSMTGINGSGITYTVTGLPTGATAVVSPNPATASGALNLTINTTSVAEGVYTFSLNGTGTDTNGNPVSGNLLYTLQAGYIWSAPTGGNLATAANWTNSALPGVSDDIIFTDVGGTSGAYTPAAPTGTNILITANTTNGSVRFAQTNNITKYYNILLSPGVTWALTGTNGFSFLRDIIDNTAGNGNGATMTFAGTNGATVAVQNESANFSLLLDNQVAYLTDFSQLDNFKADLNIFSIGDFRMFPNFSNYDSNSIGSSMLAGGLPAKFLASINLARTNVIKGVYADPFNYTNDTSREFGLSFLASESSGSTTVVTMNLGVSNIFLADAANFCGAASELTVKYNTAMLVSTNIVGSVTNLTTNLMSSVFRNTNGTSRMSVFEVGDGGGINAPNNNKLISTVNFASVLNGQVDILADRLYVARDRQNISSNGSPIYQGYLYFGNGTVDANTVIVGDRQFHQTNTFFPEIPQSSTYPDTGYCQGTLSALSNTVVKINNLLTIGATAASSTTEEGGGNNNDSGTVSIANGATLNVNAIYVGGPSYGWSTNNYLIISNNALVNLTNYCGSTNQGLNKLELDNGSTLSVNLNATNLGPYIFTTNFTTVGANTLNIQSIKNLSAYSSPITLMTFTAGGGAFTSVTVPSGVGAGAIIFATNNGLISMNLTIITNTPKHIVWRGYASGNWDLASINWLDQNTGLHTNFANGDFVTFDDTEGVPTIHLTGATDIIPGPITMSNSLEYYTIDSAGGGAIFGTATLTKTGSNGLEVDGSTTLNIALNQGSFSGNSSGSIGNISLATNTVMTFNGSIANGITCAGVATMGSSSSGAGNWSTLGTGVSTNNGQWNGPFSIASGGQFYNNGNIGSDTTYANLGANLSTSAGSLFVNNGNLTAEVLTVNGTFVDTGAGTIYMYGDTPSSTRGLTIGTGATFIPGGYGIGTTTVAEGNREPGTISFPGRVLLSTGSTNIFKIDPSTSQYTVLSTDNLNWGPNQSALSIDGGTLVISNTSGAPFTAGQTFTIGTAYNTTGLNTTNSLPVIVPASPGPGLAWDFSKFLTTYNGSQYLNILGVIGVSTNPTTIGFQTRAGVSNTFLTELTWPSGYIGWKLQLQTITLSPGLVNNPSNWTTFAPSLYTNDVIFTNTFATNGTAMGGTLYRLTYP